MPPCQIQNRAVFQSVKSSLGQSLVRLHRSMEQTRRHEAHVESLFESWQAKWSDRRAQISRHLQQIETQLDTLAHPADSKPRLSIMGQPTSGDMVAMGSF
jgi:chromosome segregation ATPase